jgi:hypothetical protein
MKKLFLAFAALVALLGSPALAETFSSPMVQTGWAFGSGTATGTDVRSMKMVMQMSSLIRKDRYYDITFTVSGYSGTGSVRAFAGVYMPTSPTGTWVLASSITPIADRFTLGTGTPLGTGGEDQTAAPFNLTGPGSSVEDIGSMRVFCTHAKFGLVDPILNPGLIGSHIHEFVGNTGINEKSTYQTLRASGATTCQDARGNLAKYPVNPTGYWWPAVMDGMGHVIRQNGSLVYYKGPPAPSPVVNYDAPSPYGGTATATGTALVRSSGAVFTSAMVGNSIWFVGDATTYTVASFTDSSHIALTVAPSAGTKVYDTIISYTVREAARHQCNDEWGAASLTVDQLGNPVTDDGRCPQIPHGMKYIFGYNKATGQGRPDVNIDATSGDNGTGAVTSGTYGAIVMDCWKGPDAGTAHAAEATSGIYHSLADIMAATAATPSICPLGAVLHISYGGPTCWDGYHVDSPDHRAHVGYGIRPTASGFLGNQRCPATLPYPIPQMGIQNFYTIDAAFQAQKWRFSIDEMVDGLPAGIGAHMDYFWAWSPAASDLWFSHCVHPHNSCTNELGDGRTIPPPVSYDGTAQFCNGCMKTRSDRYVSVTELGMSWDYTANGTYTVRIKAPDSGVWGFMGLKGFNGAVSGVTVTEVPTGP